MKELLHTLGSRRVQALGLLCLALTLGLAAQAWLEEQFGPPGPLVQFSVPGIERVIFTHGEQRLVLARADVTRPDGQRAWVIAEAPPGEAGLVGLPVRAGPTGLEGFLRRIGTWRRTTLVASDSSKDDERGLDARRARRLRLENAAGNGIELEVGQLAGQYLDPEDIRRQGSALELEFFVRVAGEAETYAIKESMTTELNPRASVWLLKWFFDIDATHCRELSYTGPGQPQPLRIDLTQPVYRFAGDGRPLWPRQVEARLRSLVSIRPLGSGRAPTAEDAVRVYKVTRGDGQTRQLSLWEDSDGTVWALSDTAAGRFPLRLDPASARGLLSLEPTRFVRSNLGLGPSQVLELAAQLPTGPAGRAQRDQDRLWTRPPGQAAPLQSPGLVESALGSLLAQPIEAWDLDRPAPLPGETGTLTLSGRGAETQLQFRLAELSNPGPLWVYVTESATSGQLPERARGPIRALLRQLAGTN